MSDDIQPVVPAESENAVEQAAVAEVSAPSLEAELKEEILAEVQSELEKFPDDVFLSPDEVDALIEKIFKEDEELNWSNVLGLRIKDGVDGNHRHHEVIIGKVHSLEMAQALFASGLYDVILKED